MRPFLFCSVLAGLAIGLGCQREGGIGVSVDSVFRPLIPPDVKALVSIHLDKLLQAPLYIRHQKDVDFAQLDSASERFGLNPRRDLSDLLVVWNGKTAVLMAKGSFDQRQLKQKLGTLGARTRTYSDDTILESGNEALAFIKRGVAIAGPLSSVHAALDSKDKGSGGIPELFKQSLQGVPADDQIWIVSRGGLPFADVPMNSDWESALSNIVDYVTATTASIGVDTGMRFRADIACVSNQGAQRVHDALRAAVGFGRLSTKDNELELLKLYDSIQVTQEQRFVHVRADLKADLADKLIAQLSALQSTSRLR